jgi:hypothetical protein
MSPAYVALPLCLGLAVVATGPRYIALPGYAFRTDPSCERKAPKSAFDQKCDWPRLGIKDFSQPFTVTSGDVRHHHRKNEKGGRSREGRPFRVASG